MLPLSSLANRRFNYNFSIPEPALRLSACLWILCVLPFVASFPLPEVSLQIRQTVNCTDLKASFDSSCWTALGLSDYLEYPETGWMFTTPKCSEGQSADNCCEPDQPWSTCYLRLAHGYPGQDCSEINPQACTWDSTLAVDPRIAAEVRYVTRNIYSILICSAQLAHR